MERLNIEKLRRFVKEGLYVVSDHAKDRMIEKNITLSDIISVINTGEIIEWNPCRKPYPTFLLLGWVVQKPLHVVLSDSDKYTKIITAYWPDSTLWSSDFKKRL